MKRSRVIALALVVAVMLMGAGYATWYDTTTLTGTVRTGNLDMQITAATTRTGDNQAQNEAHPEDTWHMYDWTHANSINHDANSVTVDFKDLYPGGVVQVDMTTENKGTIPAKLESISVQLLGGNADLFNALQAQTSWKADINGDGTQDTWGHVKWGEWGNVPTELNNLAADLTSKKIVIEPKGYLKFDGENQEPGCIQFRLDPNAGNAYQNQWCQFKVTFNWAQWSNDPTAAPYNGTNGYGGDGDLQ